MMYGFCKSKIELRAFKNLMLNNANLVFVSTFKYLSHFLCGTMSNDLDIKCEIGNLYVNTNILARRYSKCLQNFKVLLFKFFCYVSMT